MIGFIGILVGLIGTVGCSMAKDQPGKLTEITETEKAMGQAIVADLKWLSEELGERNAEHYENLSKSADWIEAEFKKMGYDVTRQGYEVKGMDVSINGRSLYKGKLFYNIEAEKKGDAKEIVILGAHYDSVRNCPGADDNGSGVAVMMEAARALAGDKSKKTVRFVAFVNEEPPYFQTENMGSLVYAKKCKEREDKIEAMVCLDTVGYYTDEKGSQTYPIWIGKWLYGTRGNYLMFVSNLSNGGLANRAAKIFREKASINCEKAVFPDFVRETGFSDQWSFWQVGYEAVMATDTAMFRNRAYHMPSDKRDRLDMGSLGRVGEGMVEVMRDLAGVEKK